MYRLSPRNRLRRGITLIEILLVIGIIGMLVQLVASGLGPLGQAEVLRATNQLGSTVNYAYDRARVYGVYLRLEIDLDNGTFGLQQAEKQMYLPATDRDGKIAEYDEDKVKDQEERDKAAAERFNGSVQALAGNKPPAGSQDQVAPAAGAEGQEEAAYDPYAVGPRTVPRAKPPLFSAFAAENTLSGLGAPFELPKHAKVIGVRTDSDAEEIVKGKAYVYFFPTGRTQLANILIADDRDGGDEYTIHISPLTGRVDITSGIEHLELPEDFRGGVDDLGKSIERRSF